MWALQDARLPEGNRADIVLDGERITRVGGGAADGIAERLACTGWPARNRDRSSASACAEA